MTQDPQNNNFAFDTLNLIRFAWKRKWILIAVSTVAFIVSIAVAFSIKPTYKATAIMFPGSEISLSKTLVETSVGSNNEKDVLTFGNDVEAERLLQILRSDQLLNHMIEKFDLLAYYEVDLSPKKYPVTTVKGILGGNLKFRRTEYNSIEIEVYDHNPQMTADMANEIAIYADTIYSNITYFRSKEAYDIVSEEFNNSKQNIKDLTDSLSRIRAHGINHFERQAEALNKAYVEALVNKNDEVSKMLEKKLQILEKYGSQYDEIQFKLETDLQRLSYLEGKMAAAKMNYEHRFSNLFVVDNALVPEKKDKPKRIVIILLSTISAFLLALFALIIQNRIKASK